MDLNLAEPLTIDPSRTCNRRRQLRGGEHTVRRIRVSEGRRPELSAPGRAKAIGHGQALLAQARAVGQASLHRR